jgi:hypothetical protein
MDNNAIIEHAHAANVMELYKLFTSSYNNSFGKEEDITVAISRFKTAMTNAQKVREAALATIATL